MKKFSISIISLIIIGSLYGCAPLLLTMGAAGTAAISIDTMRLERNVELNRAWDATIAALKEQSAQIETEDLEAGLIKAMLNESNITIRITKLGSRPTAIDITSRRKGLPNLKTAEFLSEQINAQLRVKL
jgi:Protein of unknown function (DUF3568)